MAMMKCSHYNYRSNRGSTMKMIAMILLSISLPFSAIIPMIGVVDAQSTTAFAVIGQADLFSRSSDPFQKGPDPFDFHTYTINADNSGGVYVADARNHRVLYFPPGANSSAAIRVYGQPDMYSNRKNRGATNPSADSLSRADGIAIASDGIYIADSFNSRVLFYPGNSTNATRVYGQGGSFTTNNIGVSAEKFNTPWGISVDSSNNLYVADTLNHRVLFFPAGSTTATRVYGQGGSFTTGSWTDPPTVDSLNNPTGVAVSNNGVYIADQGNNRVLFYSGTSTTASIVYGQSGSFVTNVIQSSPNAQSTHSPTSVTLDNNCNLYVASYNDNRVLFFPAGSTTATRVYGQGGDFTTSFVNEDPSSLYNPTDVSIGGNALFIADTANNRVLKYPLNDGTASSSSNGPCSRNTLPAETTPPPTTTVTMTPPSSPSSASSLYDSSSMNIIRALLIHISAFLFFFCSL